MSESKKATASLYVIAHISHKIAFSPDGSIAFCDFSFLSNGDECRRFGSMKKALITGGTGFIGSSLARSLIRKGFDVVIPVRATSSRAYIPRGAQIIHASLDNTDGFISVLPECTHIFHIAGLTKARKAADFYRVNVDGTKKMIELAAKYAGELKHFVFLSSQAASRPGQDKTDETAPCAPISHYGKSKLQAERVVLSAADALPVSVIRPPAVYGPRDSDIFLYFRMAHWGLVPIVGSQDRAFSAIFITDLVRAIELVGRSPEAVGRLYFATDGVVHTWGDFADAVANVVSRISKKTVRRVHLPFFALYPAAAIDEFRSGLAGRTALLSFDKAREMRFSWVASSERIRNELGFEPIYSLERGLETAYRWYRIVGWLK